MTILVGDIHGKFSILDNVLEAHKGLVIQLGDLGIGFPCQRINSAFFCDSNQPYYIYTNTDFKFDKRRFRFIRGNHDNPKICRKHKNYLGDYGIFNDLFFVSGAWSIDRQVRTEGIDWWADEELSIKELNDMLDKYEQAKPDIVISHECPLRILDKIHSQIIPSRTGQALDQMLEIHIPKAWYFAHHHRSLKYIYDNKCLFQCICTNEIVKI